MQNSLKNKFNNLSPEQIRKLVASRNRSLKTSASKTFEKMLRNPEEHYPLSKAQERIWFLSYLFKNTSLYNIPVAVKIYKAISLENLELALEQIVVNNDILRTTFHEKNGEIYQHIHPKYKPSIDYQDISNNIEKKKLIEKLMKRDTLGSVNFDAIIIADFNESLKSVTTSLLYTDISPKKKYFITFNQWFDESLLEEASTQPLYFPSINQINYEDFSAEYFDKFNQYPNQLSFLSFDLVGLVYYLIIQNNSIIDEKIFTKKNLFKGKVGIFEIKNNKINHILNFYKVENDEFKKIF